MRVVCLLALLLPLAACQRPTGPHYVVGKPYLAGGMWRYPRERFDLTETGLATVFRGGTPTADGEAWSDGAMLAASPTLQLPAAVRVTNLDNGLQAVLRVVDRGPVNPGRVIGVSPRVALLLGASGSTAFPVRVRVLRQASMALAAALQGGGSPGAAAQGVGGQGVAGQGVAGQAGGGTAVRVAAAPAGSVTAQGLAPPPGGRGSAGAVRGAAPASGASLFRTGPVFPLRPPEELTRVAAQPGRLYVDCGGVGNPDDAELLAARLARFGARAVPDYSYPMTQAFRARIGPLANVAAADAMQARVLRAGIANARIVVK